MGIVWRVTCDVWHDTLVVTPEQHNTLSHAGCDPHQAWLGYHRQVTWPTTNYGPLLEASSRNWGPTFYISWWYNPKYLQLKTSDYLNILSTLFQLLSFSAQNLQDFFSSSQIIEKIRKVYHVLFNLKIPWWHPCQFLSQLFGELFIIVQSWSVFSLICRLSRSKLSSQLNDNDLNLGLFSVFPFHQGSEHSPQLGGEFRINFLLIVSTWSLK